MEHTTHLPWTAARGEGPAGGKKTNKQIDDSHFLTGGCSDSSSTVFAPQILRVLGQVPPMPAGYWLGEIESC